jgi:hypothetical protein
VVGLILFPFSYLGYAAWPKWRQPVTPRQRVTMLLFAAGANLLPIGQRLESISHSPIIRGLSFGVLMLGCALMIVAGLRGEWVGPQQ